MNCPHGRPYGPHGENFCLDCHAVRHRMEQMIRAAENLSRTIQELTEELKEIDKREQP